MKKLHIYLIKKYVPPFLATLFIAVFVFFMIFVFTYIDEIAGKGIDSWTLTKMFFFTFLMFIPSSMPLAVLLSSIMTLGNLGETYELAAMKSSGLSLLKIMKPLLIFILFLAVFCFSFSNYTLPYIHLKQASMLYDVRGAKPALNIKESVFYNGIDGYSIRVGRKDNDGKTIRDILIYDHTEKRGNMVQMYADSGKLETSENKNALIMTLYNGHRYQQVLNDNIDVQMRPMISALFKKQIVYFDLSGLKMERSDEELFKNNADMMNLTQLTNYIDTVKVEDKRIADNIINNVDCFFLAKAKRVTHLTDSLQQVPTKIREYLNKMDPVMRRQIYETATNQARNMGSLLEGKIQSKVDNKLDGAKYKVFWHKKFTLSFACIVLFFVGAPLGAIVRKGGFGMPVVISVILFMVYHVISISAEKMALEGELDVVVGLWIGPLLFLPFGIWLSYKAARDSALFESSKYWKYISWIMLPFALFKRTK